MHVVLFRAVPSGMAGFQLGYCVCVVPNLKRKRRCSDFSFATTNSHSQLLEEQVPTAKVNVATKVFQKKSFDNKSGALPGTTCTRSTPFGPSNSNREYDQSHGFQCSIVTKRKVMAFSSWILSLRAQAPFSGEHPFPFFESALSNLEARASCVNHSIPKFTWGVVISSENKE